MKANAGGLSSYVDSVKEAVVDRLQNPALLRIAALSFIGLLGLGAGGVPLYSRILSLQEDYARESKRRFFIEQHRMVISKLRQFRKRVPKDGDQDWWMQTLSDTMNGCRLAPTNLSPRPEASSKSKIGNYFGITYRFQVKGPYRDVVKLIGALENQQFVVRMPNISLSSEGGNASWVSANFAISVLAVKSRSSKKASEKGAEGKDKKGGASRKEAEAAEE
jgi:hypothetical protein